jgi:hypothetical protein
MKNENLFGKIDRVIEEIKKVERKSESAPKEETDPRIVALLDEGTQIVSELDPLVRETLRDDPDALAEWDEIMHMCDDPPA